MDGNHEVRGGWPDRVKGLGLLAAACFLMVAVRAAEVHEAAVANLQELGMPPVTLRVLKRTPLSVSRDLQSATAYLPKGQPVRLLGWSGDRCYVEGRVATGPAQGWVAATAVEAPAKELLAEIQRRAVEREQHLELIQRQQVVTGMTREEVQAGLGKPERIVKVRTADGDQELWFYRTYRYAPQYQPDQDPGGQFRQSISYHRVSTGHKMVVFQGRAVARIEEPGE